MSSRECSRRAPRRLEILWRLVDTEGCRNRIVSRYTAKWQGGEGSLGSTGQRIALHGRMRHVEFICNAGGSEGFLNWKMIGSTLEGIISFFRV